jgi:hypothetical protein
MKEPVRILLLCLFLTIPSVTASEIYDKIVSGNLKKILKEV